MENTHLPAGLLNSDSELFSDDAGNCYQLISSNVVRIDFFNTPLYFALEAAMVAEASVHLNIIAMVKNAGRFAEVKQYAYCCYGGFDNQPDLINGKLTNPEYWPCAKRGNCQFEGKVCVLKTASGKVLTPREIEYTVLTAQGLLNKQIANAMGISEHTVSTHSKNIRIKTGLWRKADLTRFAIENNLLKSGASFLTIPDTE